MLNITSTIPNAGRLIVSRRPSQGIYIDDDYLVYLYMTDAYTVGCSLNGEMILLRLNQPTIFKGGKYSVEFFFDRRAGLGGVIRVAICADRRVSIVRDELLNKDVEGLK